MKSLETYIAKLRLMYSDVTMINNGNLAIVNSNGKYIILKCVGDTIQKHEEFKSAWGITEVDGTDYMVVETIQGKKGIINTNFDYTIPAIHRLIETAFGRYAICKVKKSNDYNGVYRFSGENVIPMYASRDVEIYLTNHGYIILQRGSIHDETGPSDIFYDENGKVLYRAQDCSLADVGMNFLIALYKKNDMDVGSTYSDCVLIDIKTGESRRHTNLRIEAKYLNEGTLVLEGGGFRKVVALGLREITTY